jgi:hypothetical protein
MWMMWGWTGVGVCMLLGGVAAAVHTWLLLRNGVEATGTVVDMTTVRDSEDGSESYAPVFRFMAADQQSYTIHSKTSTNPPVFKVGEAVRVIYPPLDPASAKIASFWQLWLTVVILAGLGVIFVAIGLFFLRYLHSDGGDAAMAISRGFGPG